MDQSEPGNPSTGVFGSQLDNGHRKLKLIVAVAFLIVTVVGVLSAVLVLTKGEASKNTQLTVEEISKEVAIVEITASGFEPASIGVKAGQQVRFINQDTAKHRLQADPELLHEFDSNIPLSTGDSYTYVFDTPGTYHYYDIVVPESFTGSVEVRA